MHAWREHKFAHWQSHVWHKQELNPWAQKFCCKSLPMKPGVCKMFLMNSVIMRSVQQVKTPEKIGIFHVMALVDEKQTLIFVQNCSVRSKQAIISQTPWSEMNQFWQQFPVWSRFPRSAWQHGDWKESKQRLQSTIKFRSVKGLSGAWWVCSVCRLPTFCTKVKVRPLLMQSIVQCHSTDAIKIPPSQLTNSKMCSFSALSCAICHHVKRVHFVTSQLRIVEFSGKSLKEWILVFPLFESIGSHKNNWFEKPGFVQESWYHFLLALIEFSSDLCPEHTAWQCFFTIQLGRKGSASPGSLCKISSCSHSHAVWSPCHATLG